MYELLAKIKNVHVMQLPQSQNDDNSREMWYKEVLLLKERIEREFEVNIADKNIRSAIQLKNEERRLLKEFYDLNKSCPPMMNGAEQLKVLYGSKFKFDLASRNSELREIIDVLDKRYDDNIRDISKSS